MVKALPPVVPFLMKTKTQGTEVQVINLIINLCTYWIFHKTTRFFSTAMTIDWIEYPSYTTRFVSLNA